MNFLLMNTSEFALLVHTFPTSNANDEKYKSQITKKKSFSYELSLSFEIINENGIRAEPY